MKTVDHVFSNAGKSWIAAAITRLISDEDVFESYDRNGIKYSDCCVTETFEVVKIDRINILSKAISNLLDEDDDEDYLKYLPTGSFISDESSSSASASFSDEKCDSGHS